MRRRVGWMHLWGARHAHREHWTGGATPEHYQWLLHQHSARMAKEDAEQKAAAAAAAVVAVAAAPSSSSSRPLAAHSTRAEQWAMLQAVYNQNHDDNIVAAADGSGHWYLARVYMRRRQFQVDVCYVRFSEISTLDMASGRVRAIFATRAEWDRWIRELKAGDEVDFRIHGESQWRQGRVSSSDKTDVVVVMEAPPAVPVTLLSSNWSGLLAPPCSMSLLRPYQPHLFVPFE